LLRDNLHDGSPELRQAYARLLLSEVSVTSEEIRISGSPSWPGPQPRGSAQPRPLFSLLFGNNAPFGAKQSSYIIEITM
jgi:hypothetical protein